MTSALPIRLASLKGLRVCLLAGTLEPGGAERQLYYVARALQQFGSKVQVLSLTRGDFWEEPLLRCGIPVTWVGQSPSRLVRLVRIIRVLRDLRADIVHCQHFYTNLYGAVAARFSGIREVGGIRSNVLSELAGISKPAGTLSLRLPKVLAANSQAAITTLSNLGVPLRRTFFLPNVIDTEQFCPRPDEVCNGSSVIRLLAVGRLWKEKRFDRFIELVAQLRTKTTLPVKGIIVGSGRSDRDLRPALEQQAARLGLGSKHLEFTGAARDMESVYRGADILVLTSDYEGTPNVILEAMASALPVVATNVGGVPELVQHGRTGYLVRTDELKEMVNQTLKLINDREHRLLLGRQARVQIELTHSLIRLPEYLVALYRQAMCCQQRAHGIPSSLPAEVKP